MIRHRNKNTYFPLLAVVLFIHLGCFVVSSPVVPVLSGANVNVGRGSDSPLHAAVRQDSADQVSVLLDYGADVNLRDSNNQRPTELAPAGGKTQQLLKTFEGTA